MRCQREHVTMRVREEAAILGSGALEGQGQEVGLMHMGSLRTNREIKVKTSQRKKTSMSSCKLPLCGCLHWGILSREKCPLTEAESCPRLIL